jgi:hypothetical protein
MTTANGRAGDWRRTDRNHPCPVCQRFGWCRVTSDGRLAACRYVEPGCWKSKADKNGAPVYLHRLDGAARPVDPEPRRPSVAGAERAGPELLHRAYSALLAGLPLSKAHREALRNRGLTDEEIDRREYRTLPRQGRAQLARELRGRDDLGDALLTVPGFHLKQGDGGRPYISVAGAAGLLVPVRDRDGRIAALLSRPDDAGDGPRYSYLSSVRYGGPGAGAPAHVPKGTPATAETVRLTEGALKADVATALSGLLTVGAPGAGNWRPALDALLALGCKTARLAFDADALDNPNVARALESCAKALTAAGLAVELERWPATDGKGIDDLLAAGKTPELLAGDLASAAIAEALAAATADEALPDPGPLARIDDILADGGAPALFGDRPLLDALARLKDSDPPAFAARRATLKGRGVSLRDLDAALKPFLRERARERPPVLLTEAGYLIQADRICREHSVKDGGSAIVPLCNFTARVTEVVTRDDGAEVTSLFTVAGALADGRELAPVQVPAADFAGLAWVTTAWHGEAVVYAGQGTRDHLRAAIELLSPDRARRTVYVHTGWRRDGNSWQYLHGAGAIGPSGPAAGVEVSLPDPLAGFVLPPPPQGEALVSAVRASLGLLNGLVPDRIAFPLLAAVFRAGLGDAPGPIDFSPHLAGPHGAGKSELAALAQQHFGAGLDARHLPGNWASTENATEGLAFACKDGLLVIDDWAPTGTTADVQRLRRAADRVFRGQGNRAGRQRMRPDGSLRPPKPPRGLILSTGEDVPPGQSLRGRILVLEVSPGELNWARLTTCQRDAAAGLYAAALSGFVRWLAPQYDELAHGLPVRRAELRDRALAESAPGSARTPGILADLALGLSLFLDFAVTAGAITQADREALSRRGWLALVEAAARHSQHVEAAEPTALFLRLLAAAMASGRAHAAGPNGSAPEAPEAWGWRRRTVGAGDSARDDWQSGGERIGWLDGADLYLEPEASYAAAQELARDQGEVLSVSPRTLHRRLRERSLLVSWDERRKRLTVRRTLEGVAAREVLHLRADALSPGSELSKPSISAPDAATPGEKWTVPMDGSADGNGHCGRKRPSETSTKPVENATGGRCGLSDSGGEARQGAERTPPQGKRQRGVI